MADLADADLCSVKCAVGNRRNVVTKLQALEYRMAMLSRHFRPWLTSGACFLARTDALRQIMARHSKWTPGEDIETGRTALALRMPISHLDMAFTPTRREAGAHSFTSGASGGRAPTQKGR